MSEKHKDQIKKLKEALHKIDWDLVDIGCGHYRLRDHNGDLRDFEYCSGKITGFKLKPKRMSSTYFLLEECHIYTTGNNSAVTIQAKGTEGVFLQFYNFNNKGKE